MNIKFFNKIVSTTAACLFVMLMMTSCLDDDDMEPTPIAYVSIFQSSPDAPDLDLALDNRLIFNQPMEYTDYSGYLQFYTGTRRLEVSEYNASNILADTSYNFQADKAYSVFLADEVDELSTVILEDSVSIPAEGKAWVRFIHLSPDAPEVDFTVGDNGSLSFTNQAFKDASDITEIDADSYTMSLSATAGEEALVSVPETELKSQGIYTIVARGFVEPPAGNTNALNIQIIKNQ